MSSEDESSTEGIMGESSVSELRQHLQQMEEDYRIPYNQRKSDCYEDPKEELIQVMQDISTRENNCRAVAGISLYLMDKNEQLIYQVQSLEENIENIQSEVQSYKEQLVEKSQLLQRFEEKLQNKKRKQILLKSEIDEKKGNIREMQENIESLKKNYEQVYIDYLQLESEHQDSQRSQRANTLINEQRQKLEQEKAELMEKLDQIALDNTDLEKKLSVSRQNEQKQQSLATAIQEDLDETKLNLQEEVVKYEHAVAEIGDCKEQIDQLQQKVQLQKEEMIHVKQQLEMELVKRMTIESRCTFGSEFDSLQSQRQSTALQNLYNELGGDFDRRSDVKKLVLECIDEEEENLYVGTPKMAFNTPKSMKFEAFQDIKLTLENIETVHIIDGQLYTLHSQPFRKAKRQIKPRKKPLEEYFHLLIQAVKLNSPYMDSICTINAEVLYSMVQQEGISFENWHSWIEKQLNRLYMDNYYNLEVLKKRKEEKKSVKRQKLKEFKIQLNT